jgi:rod shape-determining protein MreC
VPSPGNDATPLFAEADSSTLGLVGLAILAAVLMVADHRGQYLETVRREAATLAGPLYWLATAPTRAFDATRQMVADRQQLAAENEALRKDLLLARATLARLATVSDQNDRLRQLLDARTRIALKAQLAELVDVDLEPFRHRVLINLGKDDGVAEGQAVMDADGVLGQLIEVQRERSVLILLTDPAHSIPVRVVRTGLRTIAYGSGSIDSLNLPHIPFSAGVRVGDVLVTSGIGGRFPAGLPVGVVRELEPDDSATFVRAIATPAAAMARSGEVLVLHDERLRLADPRGGEVELVGPPEPLPPAADPDPAP